MEAPYYRPMHREVEVFYHAYRNQLALMLKGPTGCGKSRFSRPWQWRCTAP
jgi:nitric oxide reductase NorQ protein